MDGIKTHVTYKIEYCFLMPCIKKGNILKYLNLKNNSGGTDILFKTL